MAAVRLGDYVRQLEVIGKGSCGTVYKGYEVSTRKVVALKKMNLRNYPPMAISDQIAKVSCPANVLLPLATLASGPYCYYITPYVKGINLTTFLQQNSPFCPAEAKHYGSELRILLQALSEFYRATNGLWWHLTLLGEQTTSKRVTIKAILHPIPAPVRSEPMDLRLLFGQLLTLMCYGPEAITSLPQHGCIHQRDLFKNLQQPNIIDRLSWAELADHPWFDCDSIHCSPNEEFSDDEFDPNKEAAVHWPHPPRLTEDYCRPALSSSLPIAIPARTITVATRPEAVSSSPGLSSNINAFWRTVVGFLPKN